MSLSTIWTLLKFLPQVLDVIKSIMNYAQSATDRGIGYDQAVADGAEFAKHQVDRATDAMSAVFVKHETDKTDDAFDKSFMRED